MQNNGDLRVLCSSHRFWLMHFSRGKTISKGWWFIGRWILYAKGEHITTGDYGGFLDDGRYNNPPIITRERIMIKSTYRRHLWHSHVVGSTLPDDTAVPVDLAVGCLIKRRSGRSRRATKGADLLEWFLPHVVDEYLCTKHALYKVEWMILELVSLFCAQTDCARAVLTTPLDRSYRQSILNWTSLKLWTSFSEWLSSKCVLQKNEEKKFCRKTLDLLHFWYMFHPKKKK
jgi:hypothetical protein